MVCPEPGAITVLKLVQRKADEEHGVEPGIAGAGECASN
jgi:hypothetical protein